MILEILVCTHAENIEKVADLPVSPRPDVRYLISWQRTNDSPALPKKLVRSDIRICETSTYGLSANRNNALRHASGDVLLFSDSDCRYTDSGLDNILDAFAKHTDADILLFEARTYDGLPLHHYIGVPYDYARRPRCAHASSWEIAVRRDARIPFFDLRFGIGAPLMGCGEEEIFLQDCLIRGLSIRYLPLPIVRTAASTTGTRFLSDPSVRRAKGGVCAYLYGKTEATLRCLKFALVNVPSGAKYRSFRDMWKGIRFVSCHKKEQQTHTSSSAVSVIIPYRNRKHLLSRTLDSLFRQTHRPLTLFLVDNGSTDGGTALCRAFARSHDAPDFRIRLISAPDGGASHARNAGLTAVTDPYVCFFDSDDVFDPFFLDELLSRMEREKHCNIVFAKTRMIFESGRTKVRAFPRLTLANHLLSGMISTQSFLIRTEFLRQTGGWNEALPKWNDYELGVRILQSELLSAIVVPHVFHRIYQHADSLTGSSPADRYRDLYPALSAIDRLIAGDAAAGAAFAFRRVALAIQWRRTGLVDESRELMREAMATKLSTVQRFALRLLYVYMYCRGAGAWRIFAFLLKQRKQRKICRPGHETIPESGQKMPL